MCCGWMNKGFRDRPTSGKQPASTEDQEDQDRIGRVWAPLAKDLKLMDLSFNDVTDVVNNRDDWIQRVAQCIIDAG